MLNLIVSDEQLQTAFQKTLDDMLKPGNYNNPVKQILDSMLGYSGEMKGKMGEEIKAYLEDVMQKPDFQQMLGKAIAEEMARKAVSAMEKK